MHSTVGLDNIAGEVPHAHSVADIVDVSGHHLVTTGSAEFRVEACEAVLIQIDESEVAALFPEPEGQGSADPARGPRDHRDLSAQLANALA